MQKMESSLSKVSVQDPGWEDRLIAHDTLPGLVSYRDINKGTWFIESLFKVG